MKSSASATSCKVVSKLSVISYALLSVEYRLFAGLSCPLEMRYVLPTSMIGCSRSAISRHAEIRISADSSHTSKEKTEESPVLGFEKVRMSLLFITRALIIHLFEYGFRPSMGVALASDSGEDASGW